MSPVPPRSSRRYHVGTSIVSPLRYFPHSLVNRKPPEKNLQVRRNRRVSFLLGLPFVLLDS
ncbi:hypothetical protein HanRHA438_Chr05g0212751 [Helianthus annuus]|uniref:Uncharacterized protein n=1 Tax=Helianthus annuus TaxID=4232 RepID=A0A9K3NLG9_HELAN|nr:hypothetical protein HanXRQr2_Chr05g0202851 [Helianthus annuus]KAJ0569477.1 hypothetical protein HanHA300_Chr05g0166621 [Helianthus annuus]KAJ0575967.1 hypothetical protein HanIR_Chr05g0218861 [Helianthus annuus]KAJ0583787.1 hypothetical protein HanHA89_Chr05g0180671 [Helianthus annuus]KAJ0746492.1 hypothetical protein HanOQP8_Chr05g0178311 [Helianthus annuus]